MLLAKLGDESQRAATFEASAIGYRDQVNVAHRWLVEARALMRKVLSYDDIGEVKGETSDALRDWLDEVDGANRAS